MRSNFLYIVTSVAFARELSATVNITRLIVYLIIITHPYLLFVHSVYVVRNEVLRSDCYVMYYELAFFTFVIKPNVMLTLYFLLLRLQ